MIGQGHLLQRHIAYLTFEIFLIIQYEDPEDIQQGVKEPEIQVLVFVQTVFFLRCAHTHPGLDIDIIVNAIHVRKGMVDDIVFLIPHKTVAPQDVQGESRKMIDPFIFGKNAMGSVMNHIKADSRNDPAQQHTFQDSPESSRSKKDEMNIDKRKADHQDHRLQEQAEITCSGFTYFLKIITDPFFQLSMKRLGGGGKFGR